MRPHPLTCLFLLLAPGTANAQLDLSFDSLTDISDLAFGSVGGAAFDDSTGRLWISDATGQTNDIAEIDPLTGFVFSSFDASVIPGMEAGPDALGLQPSTGNLYVYSVFTRSVAGVVTQAGGLVDQLAVPDQLAAVGFAADGTFYGIEDNAGFPDLYVIDPANGLLGPPTLLSEPVGRISALDFDPITGNLFAYSDASNELIEVDASTGEVLSATDVMGFLLTNGFPTGFAFNADGTQLYLARGSGAGADKLIVLNRTPPAECFLVVGHSRGAESFEDGGHTWETQVGDIASYHAVTLIDFPSFEIPERPRGKKLRRPGAQRENRWRKLRQSVVPVTELHAQVLMWNPVVFPDNPEQWTRGLHVTVWSDGSVSARRYGDRDGMEITLETYREGGRRYVRFPFAIDGF